MSRRTRKPRTPIPTLAEREALARARIAAIQASARAEASARSRALVTSARERLREAGRVRDPLAIRAAAERARRAREARRAPFARDIERHRLTLASEFLVGIHEPATDFTWSPA